MKPIEIKLAYYQNNLKLDKQASQILGYAMEKRGFIKGGLLGAGLGALGGVLRAAFTKKDEGESTWEHYWKNILQGAKYGGAAGLALGGGRRVASGIAGGVGKFMIGNAKNVAKLEGSLGKFKKFVQSPFMGALHGGATGMLGGAIYGLHKGLTEEPEEGDDTASQAIRNVLKYGLMGAAGGTLLGAGAYKALGSFRPTRKLIAQRDLIKRTGETGIKRFVERNAAQLYRETAGGTRMPRTSAYAENLNTLFTNPTLGEKLNRKYGVNLGAVEARLAERNPQMMGKTYEIMGNIHAAQGNKAMAQGYYGQANALGYGPPPQTGGGGGGAGKGSGGGGGGGGAQVGGKGNRGGGGQKGAAQNQGGNLFTLINKLMSGEPLDEREQRIVTRFLMGGMAYKMFFDND